MKIKVLTTFFTLLLTLNVQAGGTPEFVKFPDNYTSQTNYMTQNRVGQEQIAKIYTRDNLLQAVASDQPIPEGGTIVMEIYEPKRDRNKNPVKGSGGNYLIDHLAGIAVMEYRSEWPAEMPETERAGNWGFGLYTPDGKPKANELSCTACHWELRRVNYMFTTVPMKNHLHKHQ